MNRRYTTTKTGRAIDALILTVWVPWLIPSALFCAGLILLDSIGGHLLLAAVTAALIILAVRANGGARWGILVMAALGGTASGIALANPWTTQVSGMLHWAALILWGIGLLTAYLAARSAKAVTEDDTVWDMADKTKAGRKRSKALIVLLIVGIVMGIVIAGCKVAYGVVTPQAQQVAADIKSGQTQVTALAGDNLYTEAVEIEKTIEAECFGPQRSNAEEVTKTADFDAAVAFDAATARCTEIGVENAAFPERVTAIAEGILDVADSLGLTEILGLVRDKVTDETVQDVQNGDIEKAVKDLYAAVENGEVQ